MDVVNLAGAAAHLSELVGAGDSIATTRGANPAMRKARSRMAGQDSNLSKESALVGSHLPVILPSVPQ